MIYHDIPGSPGEREARSCHSKSAVRKALQKGEVAAIIGDSGVVDIYRDDAGQIRYISYCYQRTVESRILRTVKEAVEQYARARKFADGQI